MISNSCALRHSPSATTLAFVLAVGVIGALVQACATGRVQTATSIANTPEFQKYLATLAQDFESLNPDRILPHYSPTDYNLSFETPYRVVTGAAEHRAAVIALAEKVKELHVTINPDYEAWKDGDRVWTTIGFSANGELRNGKKFAMTGWHSAVWDKVDGRWAISYEHFGGKPEATAPPPAPVVIPPPPPTPTPVPPLQFGDVFFDFDKWAIRPDQTATLQANIDLLKAHPDVRILVEGHCDERGGESYNFGLGDRRAEAVKKYLVAKGIAPERLAVVSYGKQRPFEQGHGEPMWSKNRRAHFLVIK